MSDETQLVRCMRRPAYTLTLAPQVLGYLLNHPLAALFVGGGLAVVVPRLVRASVRFILVPAGVVLLLYLAARNPGFVWSGVSSTASGDLSKVSEFEPMPGGAQPCTLEPVQRLVMSSELGLLLAGVHPVLVHALSAGEAPAQQGHATVRRHAADVALCTARSGGAAPGGDERGDPGRQQPAAVAVHPAGGRRGGAADGHQAAPRLPAPRAARPRLRGVQTPCVQMANT